MDIWGVRKTVGAIAVAVAVAGVGGAAIAAATQTGDHANFGGFGGLGGFGGFGGPGGPPPSARTNVESDSLHGEYVVADGRGGFSTMTSQTGRITEISSSSVTARSDDGFVLSYLIHATDGANEPSFAIDDQITISARKERQTATVITMHPAPLPGH